MTGIPAGHRLAHLLGGDLLLQFQDAVQQCLGARRAARDIDVDRDDRVDALGHRVGVPVGAAGVRARTEGDDVLRLGHLVIQTPDGGGHLVGDRARDDHQVGLPRPRSERDDTQAHKIVPAHRGGDELDRAARQAEVEHPQRIAPPPVQDDSHRLGRIGRDRPHAGGRQIDRHGAHPSHGADRGPTGPAVTVRSAAHVQVSRPRRTAWARPIRMMPMKTPISTRDAGPRWVRATSAHGKR